MPGMVYRSRAAAADAAGPSSAPNTSPAPPFAMPGYEWDAVKRRFFKKDPKVRGVEDGTKKNLGHSGKGKQPADVPVGRKRRKVAVYGDPTSTVEVSDLELLDEIGYIQPKVLGGEFSPRVSGDTSTCIVAADFTQIRLQAQSGKLITGASSTARAAYRERALEHAASRMRIVSSHHSGRQPATFWTHVCALAAWTFFRVRFEIGQYAADMNLAPSDLSSSLVAVKWRVWPQERRPNVQGKAFRGVF
ncbi:hypothetical protein K437DRAFT_64700 [Tilletiaria anomala UBC 951]|uniref:Uncharacterized protein n=1 Tax=Tilletiaria anomala (strain ATCC 24038 / CBS 436.72 / UBC 951) TaxID=1037660 RepID=A0A066V2J7_TILAU|nr:uncharacterized protein K437DRAFT_64700 [Tilletiaria anomala UBC 951]KDN35917.1 hypothetical protein K437DRAFT_64700 [Tilletiaria anomala UBC 951]